MIWQRVSSPGKTAVALTMVLLALAARPLPVPGTAVKPEYGASATSTPYRHNLRVHVPQSVLNYIQQRGNARAFIEESFNWFSRYMYHATNGAHALGTVHCWTSQVSGHNIKYQTHGRPYTTVGGKYLPQWLGRIRMYASQSGTDDYWWVTTGENSVLDPERSGSILAHEWGHYAYSLYDEYAENVTTPTSEGKPRSADATLARLMGTNKQEFSVPADYGPGIDTAQKRMYGVSCWDALATRWWKLAVRGNLVWAPRSFYQDIANARRDDDLSETITDPEAIRPTVIWMDSGRVAVVFVIDVSGSMSGAKLSSTIKAAKSFVGLLSPQDINRVELAVVAYDNTAREVFPLTVYAGESTKQQIRAALDGLVMGGATNITAGLQMAYNILSPQNNATRSHSVILLSDGEHNVGVGPDSQIPAYRDAFLPISAIAFGAGADQSALKQLADETNGSFHYAQADAPNWIFRQLLQTVRPNVTVATRTVRNSSFAPTATASGAWLLDPGMALLTVEVTRAAQTPRAGLRLRNPAGQLLAPSSTLIEGGEERLWWFVDDPEPGSWCVEADQAPIGPDYSVIASASPTEEDDGVVLSGIVHPAADVSYPQAAVLSVRLQRNMPVAGAVMQAVLRKPNGSVVPLQLKDDGQDPDALAGDGTYVAYLPYDAVGDYQIEIQASNADGTAYESDLGVLYHGSAPADSTSASESMLNYGFERQEVVLLRVSWGVQQDDHGNTPQTATAAEADNEDNAGRIEYDNDVDVFRVTAPSGSSGLVFRVSAIGQGMDPVLTVFGGVNGDQPRATGELSTHMTSTGYLAVPVDANPGEILYCAVAHKAASGRGVYDFSAGTRLPNEQVGADLAVVKRVPTLYPAVARRLTYEIEVRNNGPLAASQVAVRDVLPASVVYVTGNCDGGTLQYADGVVTCTIPSLQPGETKMVTLETVPRSTGLIRNDVEVASVEPDPSPGNNSARAECTVVYPGPELTGRWQSSYQPFKQGGPKREVLMFGRVQVTNRGYKKSGGCRMDIYLSPTQSAQDGRRIYSFDVRSLSPGETSTYRVSGDVISGGKAAGQYLIGVVDSRNQVAEMDEGNNTLVFGPLK